MVSLKIIKTLRLLRKLQNLLLGSSLITIYKAFVRSYLNYGDILNDQACNMSFYQKLEFTPAWPELVRYEVTLRKNFFKN